MKLGTLIVELQGQSRPEKINRGINRQRAGVLVMMQGLVCRERPRRYTEDQFHATENLEGLSADSSLAVLRLAFTE